MMRPKIVYRLIKLKKAEREAKLALYSINEEVELLCRSRAIFTLISLAFFILLFIFYTSSWWVLVPLILCCIAPIFMVCSYEQRIFKAFERFSNVLQVMENVEDYKNFVLDEEIVLCDEDFDSKVSSFHREAKLYIKPDPLVFSTKY